jgi:hypothetical protein
MNGARGQVLDQLLEVVEEAVGSRGMPRLVPVRDLTQRPFSAG